MPVITDQDIADSVISTLPHYGPAKFSLIADRLQRYQVMKHWLRKDRVVFDHGNGIKRTLMTKIHGTARHVGLYEDDVVTFENLLDDMFVPWRRANAYWWFERREPLENRGKALIVNIIKPREVNCMLSVAGILEDGGWAVPSVDDKVAPYGVPYWLTMNSQSGFYGGAPSGHTLVAGLNPSEVTCFKNWTDTWSKTTKPDFVRMLKKAYRHVHWESPMNRKEFYSSNGKRYRLYTDETTFEECDELGEAQNDNLGRDLAPYEGTITFKRHPILWIPKIDQLESPSRRLYMIDHDTFFIVVLKGDYLRRSDPRIPDKNHNVFIVWLDLSYNFLCINPAANAAFYKV